MGSPCMSVVKAAMTASAPRPMPAREAEGGEGPGYIPGLTRPAREHSEQAASSPRTGLYSLKKHLISMRIKIMTEVCTNPEACTFSFCTPK